MVIILAFGFIALICYLSWPMLKKVLFPQRGWLKNADENDKYAQFRPCVLSKEKTKHMFDADIIKIYEPAVPYADAKIALASRESIKYPLNKQEIAELKKGLKWVWCDGFESDTWQDRECKYLGIRITDSFILHETVVPSTWADSVWRWRNLCQARYLLWEELMVLNYVWQEVNEMRRTAHDVLLPNNTGYWYDTEARGETFRHMNRQGEVWRRDTEDYASLLLAVM